MLATLPILFLALAIAYSGVLDEWRIALTKGAIAWGVATAVNTEALSLIHGLLQAQLAAAWAVECAVFLVLIWLRRAALVARLKVWNPSARGWRVVAAVSPLIAIAAATAVIATVAPPNTYDAMTYHMARVAHWAADGTVALYPTSTLRQLYLNPWSEYAVLQFQVLSGGDRLANLVQWFAMAGSAVVASLIARQLQAPARGQVLAAIAVGTLPMGILEASSTQNDYSASFWLLCCVTTALMFVAAPSRQGAFWVGASVGLALLTKGTSYIFVAPLALLLAGWMATRWRTRFLAPAAVMVVLPLLLNLGMYVRNEAQFQNPLGPKEETSSLTNATYEPAAVVSNLLRDSVLQVGTPSASVNQRIEWAIDKIHSSVLHIDVNDPRTTFGTSKFTVFPFSLDEDYAGNPLQALAAVAVTLAALALWRRAPPLTLYAGALVVGFILFAGYLRWQPWISRLELPLLVAAGPLIGTVLARRFKTLGVCVVVAVLVVGAVPYVIDNQSRPMVGFAFPLNPRLLPEGQTIFSTPRDHLYFIKAPTLEDPATRIAADSRSNACREIALWLRENDWEYPFWALTEGRSRLDHVFVWNASASAFQFGTRPCLVVTSVANPPPRVYLNGKGFTQSWSENGVALYVISP